MRCDNMSAFIIMDIVREADKNTGLSTLKSASPILYPRLK